MTTTTAEIARARPWLGTIVVLRVGGLSEARARDAIETAFAEIGAGHRCMSFHEHGSDLSRLHRAAGAAIAVDRRTYEVLERAIAIAAESDGLFDPSIGSRLVEWNLLPRPIGGIDPDPRATWRDIELLGDSRVRLRRQLWIDLGGIAKGFAVDRALAILREHGATSASVNAGGDLARFGAGHEAVALDTGSGGCAVAVELGSEAVATSSGFPHARRHARAWRNVHVHGRERHATGVRRSVSVVACSCCTADALTKVLLADLRAGEALLRRHRARAYVFDVARGWRGLGAS